MQVRTRSDARGEDTSIGKLLVQVRWNVTLHVFHLLGGRHDFFVIKFAQGQAETAVGLSVVWRVPPLEGLHKKYIVHLS